MKLNTRVRYGLRAILRIAEGYGGPPVPISTIAEEQAISSKYLEQVIGPLRRKGLVVSQKGVRGGYSLAADPDKITLWHVIEALDSHPHLIECVEKPDSCSRAVYCLAHEIWKSADHKLQEFWRSQTLADLLRQADARSCAFPCEI